MLRRITPLVLFVLYACMHKSPGDGGSPSAPSAPPSDSGRVRASPSKPSSSYQSQPPYMAPRAIPDSALMIEEREHPAEQADKPRPSPFEGFTSSASDPLSTFAIDVDTASYTAVRRMLIDGYLPPVEGVRIEEFINYFPYVYPPPAEGDPFGVDFDVVAAPFDDELTLLRVGVQGKRIHLENRTPAHLTFLVDVSGSMKSFDKLDLVKQSLIMLTRSLDDGDTIAIATYAGAQKVVLEPTSIGQSETIVASLADLHSGGSTAMGAGIDLAYQLADKSYAVGHNNRVILCSDGDANVGIVDPKVLSDRIADYAKKGITLTTLGFGTGNYNDTMMEGLANRGDGNYYYIDSEREARRVLVDKLTSTLEVIAKDVKIQVDFDPAVVSSYRLLGYDNRRIADEDFRDDKVDAGEIGAGHQVTALYELRLAQGATGEIATVRIRNKAPGPEAPAVERSFVVETRSVRAFEEATANTRLAAAAAYFAEKLRNNDAFKVVSYADLALVAARSARIEYGEDRELVELIRRASTLNGEVVETARE